MKLNRIYFIVGLFVFIQIKLIAAFPNPESDSLYKAFEFEVGEELTYNVSYAFITLGQIRLKILEKIIQDGKVMYKTIAYMDSYKGLPFIDLHEIYESKINSNVTSYWFRSRSKDGSKIKYVTYDFDYANNRIFFEFGIWGKGMLDKRDTLKIDTLSQDGLSLFYFARYNLLRNRTVRIPTVVVEQISNTTINFSNKNESVNIDAVDYPVDVIEFNGRADFKGVYGFSGGFEGWFSNDEARVPIVAKMKVLIGKVRIELVSWKKKNWKPPIYQSKK
ncbi:MAG: DUF3108 domain-containing protein [Bacteroidota bacterium]|nr:DUF3108 domain-containing protein [Bacteroidota bacterium]